MGMSEKGRQADRAELTHYSRQDQPLRAGYRRCEAHCKVPDSTSLCGLNEEVCAANPAHKLKIEFSDDSTARVVPSKADILAFQKSDAHPQTLPLPDRGWGRPLLWISQWRMLMRDGLRKEPRPAILFR